MSTRPDPKLRIHLDDLTHPGTSLFLSLVNASRLLPSAIEHILEHLYRPCPGSTVPPTRSVTLVLRPMDGVAYTTGLPIDDLHKEVHCNLNYITRSSKDPKRCRDEIIGVVTHEIVHCYQWNALGTAPGGLIEGIADYVRLKAGLAPPHWKGPKEELGESWDAGYQKTAYFLDWLEHEHGTGTVGKINETLRAEKYHEDEFWVGIFGEGNGIQDLWTAYRASLVTDGDGNNKTNAVRDSSSSEDDDAVLVERKLGIPFQA